jgi:hypothetical protein
MSKPNYSTLRFGALALQVRHEILKHRLCPAIVFASASVEVVTNNHVIHAYVEYVRDVVRVGIESLLRVFRAELRPLAALVFIVERPHEVDGRNYLIDEIVPE